jgi:hypothetical protein
MVRALGGSRDRGGTSVPDCRRERKGKDKEGEREKRPRLESSRDTDTDKEAETWTEILREGWI